MTDAPSEQQSPSSSPRDAPGERACLRCKTVFHSEGFGERICPRCKGSVIWKSGLPARGDGNRQR